MTLASPLAFGAGAAIGGALFGQSIVGGNPLMALVGWLLWLVVCFLPTAKIRWLVVGIGMLFVMLGALDGHGLARRMALSQSLATQPKVVLLVEAQGLALPGEYSQVLRVVGGEIPGIGKGGLEAFAFREVLLRSHDIAPQPGEVWQATGYLAGPSGPTGLFSRPPHLSYAARGELGKFHVESKRLVEKRGGIFTKLEALKLGFVKNWYYRLSPESAGILSGLVLGEAAPHARPLVENMRDMGALHLLVISGSHLTLLFGVLWVVLRTGGLGYFPRLALSGLLICFYGVLTGGVSVFRALLMLLGLILARGVGRGIQFSNLLGGAIILILASDTLAILNPGFCLSVAATAGLLTSLFYLKDLPEVGPWWDKVRLSLWSSLFAWVFTAPLLAYFFGALSPMGPISTLLLVPQTSLLLGSGLLDQGVFRFIPGLGEVSAWFLEIQSRLLIGVCDVFSGLTPWVFPAPLVPTLLFSLALFFGLVALATWAQEKQLAAAVPYGQKGPVVRFPSGAQKLALGGCVWLSGFFMWTIFNPPPHLRVVVFKTQNQVSMGVKMRGGGAIFLYPPKANQLFSKGRSSLVPVLQGQGFSKLDLVVAKSEKAEVGGLEDFYHPLGFSTVVGHAVFRKQAMRMGSLKVQRAWEMTGNPEKPPSLLIRAGTHQIGLLTQMPQGNEKGDLLVLGVGGEKALEAAKFQPGQIWVLKTVSQMIRDEFPKTCFLDLSQLGVLVFEAKESGRFTLVRSSDPEKSLPDCAVAVN